MESQVSILQNEIRAVRTLHEFCQQDNVRDDAKLEGNLDKRRKVHDKLVEWRSNSSPSIETPKLEVDVGCFERPKAEIDLQLGAYHSRGLSTMWVDIDRKQIHSLVYLERTKIRLDRVINVLRITDDYRKPNEDADDKADTEYEMTHGGDILRQVAKNITEFPRSLRPRETYAVQTAQGKYEPRPSTQWDFINAVTLSPSLVPKESLTCQPGRWPDGCETVTVMTGQKEMLLASTVLQVSILTGYREFEFGSGKRFGQNLSQITLEVGMSWSF